jgi:hypothetical protein
MFVPLTLDIVPSEWTLKPTGRKKEVVLFVSTSHAPTNGAQDDARAVPTDEPAPNVGHLGWLELRLDGGSLL